MIRSGLAGAGLVLLGVLIGVLLPARKVATPVVECMDRSGQVMPHCV